jgi:hypothetical protein
VIERWRVSSSVLIATEETHAFTSKELNDVMQLRALSSMVMRAISYNDDTISYLPTLL